MQHHNEWGVRVCCIDNPTGMVVSLEGTLVSHRYNVIITFFYYYLLRKTSSQ